LYPYTSSFLATRRITAICSSFLYMCAFLSFFFCLRPGVYEATTRNIYMFGNVRKLSATCESRACHTPCPRLWYRRLFEAVSSKCPLPSPPCSPAHSKRNFD
jgi:hypothetical protein